MKKHVLIVLFSLGFSFSISAQGAGASLTYDPWAYVQGYTQLMNDYDIAMTQYQNYVTTVEALQEAVKNAQSINFDELGNVDWESAKFPDYREQLKDAGTAINEQSDKLRRAYDAANAKNIVIDGKGFSLRDIYGFGDENRTIWDLAWASEQHIENTAGEAVKSITDGITPAQRMAVGAKYGFSPENYVMYRETGKLVWDKIEYAAGLSDPGEASASLMELKSRYADVWKAMDGGDKTVPQLLEAMAMANQVTNDMWGQMMISTQAYQDAMLAAKMKEDKDKELYDDSKELRSDTIGDFYLPKARK